MGNIRPDRSNADMKGVKEIRKFFGFKPITLIKRNCLNCEKEFLSEGVNNRMCKYCGEFAYRQGDGSI